MSGREAECARLEIVYTGRPVSGVQIPPHPPLNKKEHLQWCSFLFNQWIGGFEAVIRSIGGWSRKTIQWIVFRRQAKSGWLARERKRPMPALLDEWPQRLGDCWKQSLGARQIPPHLSPAQRRVLLFRRWAVSSGAESLLSTDGITAWASNFSTAEFTMRLKQDGYILLMCLYHICNHHHH